MDRKRFYLSLQGKAFNRLRDIWVRTLALAIVLAISGCDTKNVGVGKEPDRGPIVSITAPTDGLNGFGISAWTANWVGGIAPYTVSWDFGGAAENVVQENAISPAQVDTQWMDYPAPMDVTISVTVTDANGLTGFDNATVHIVEGHGFLSINKVEVDGPWLYVTVSDTDGDTITVYVSHGAGMSADNNTQVVTGGSGTASFSFTADDVLLGALDEIGIIADDGSGATDSASATIEIPPMILEPDTLYAIPRALAAAVGDPVTIQVVTGETAQPFQFMLNIGVVLDSDASYATNTFNVGAVGGNTDDADGVWSDITSNGGFILGPDMFIMPGANPEDSLGDKQRFDFNISPLGGTDVASVEGALFNFMVSYSAAGEKQIGFQEFNGVNRTYYSDLASTEDHFWGAYESATINVN